MRRRLGVLAVAALIAGTPASVLADPPSTNPADELPVETVAWSDLSEPEQRLVTSQLESTHWPMRAIALLRLERYEGPERETLVRARLGDDAWQVRCFALRSAWRMGVTIPADAFAHESDGRVIRAALRHGAPIDPERLEPAARRLMRSKQLDDQLLGIEIAAASNIESLRREATRRTQRLFRRMDESLFRRITRRLARLVGRDPEDADSVRGWRIWLDARDGNVTLPAPPPATATDAGLELPLAMPLVAELDFETFSRLLDYLDGLRQRNLDVAIVMDVTTSMEPMINEARAGVESLILFLDDISRTMRLALIAYRDYDNRPVWEGERLTTDVDAIRDFLYAVRITGGRNLPEAVLAGLTACGDIGWSRDATRQIVLVGDARPHDEDMYKLTSLLENYRTNEIVVHAVHVPMEMHPRQAARLPSPFLEQRRAEIGHHNEQTAAAFASIANDGGGEFVTLERVRDLVPSIMRTAIEPGWRAYFDEFYWVYLELCRGG